MKGRDIIVVGQQPWDVEIGSNCKNIAIELSKSNRVLYVNSPLDRITVLRGRGDVKINKRLEVVRGTKGGLVRIDDNLWNYTPDCIVESINWIKIKRVFNFLNYYNNKIFAKSIFKAISELGLENYILFNDNEIFKAFFLKDLLKPSLSVYYSRDYMIGVDYWKTHGEILEPKLIEKSDVCVANSVFLQEYCAKYNDSSFYVGQGCDFDVFSAKNLDVPSEFRKYKGPFIGYVGALQSIRLDLEIIHKIALTRPDWTIILVGPEDDVFLKSDLHALSNVVFTGPKEYEDLPKYLRQFDVAINPQLVNSLTIGNYPRKIDEYLFMGKPVVATSTPTMLSFSDYVYLANTCDEYPMLIAKALEEDSSSLQENRKRFALTHSWENSVKNISEAILHVHGDTL